MDGMDNTRERSINVVIQNKLKMLTGLGQKARGVVQGVFRLALPRTRTPPAKRAVLTHPVIYVEHGKPVGLPSG